MLKEDEMSQKRKISPLLALLLVLLSFRVISSISIAYYVRDLYSLVFSLTYLAALFGSFLKKKLTYLLATGLAAIDAILGLTMTRGSIFYGALIIDALILSSAVMVYRQQLKDS
jgi:hypothetical protein